MRNVRINNYILDAPVKQILEELRLTLTNGKLKDIEDKGDNILVTCPHHGDGRESKPACNIYVGDDKSIEYGYFRCFVCEEQGSFVKFVSECFDSSEEFARSWLLDRYGKRVENAVQIGERIDVSKAAQSRRLFSKTFSKSSLDGYQSYCPYLAKRRISQEICELFKVKYDPKFRQIVFPCFDRLGNIIMLPKRSIDTKTFYLDKDAEKPVYCLHVIQKNNIEVAMITEGPFDTLTGWEYGMPTIGTFGNPSDFQIEQINRSGLKVLYLAFDNDEAGRRFTQSVKRRLDRRILTRELRFPPNKKDVNDLSYEEFKTALQNAKNEVK